MRRFYRSLNLHLARERRLCAVHEGGHFVVASYLGYKPPFFYIEKAFQRYVGRVDSPPSFNLPQHGRLVGVAGGVAECCWENRENVEAPALLSGSDWKLTGCPPVSPMRPACRHSK